MTQSNKSTKTPSYDAAGVVVKKLDGSQVEITASVPFEVWGKYRTEALKHLNDSVSLDGFRKGNIPENILISKIGEMAVLEEMAELAVPKAYVEILIDQKIDAVGRPQISVTKIAADNPLEFKAVTAVVPEVTLPDYKKIAAAEIKKAGTPDKKVSDKEIDDAVLRIRKMHASHEGHDHDKMTPEEHEKAVMANLPELTDEFVKKLGDFKDVPDFKNKLSEMIGEDKVNASNEKRRIAIADAIAEKTTIDLPKVMVESELDRTQAQFSADVERMGVKLEDYLKHAKKTLEEVRKEWLPHAEKKAKLQLVLNEISKKENIHPTAEEIETEVSHITAHYKDADRERAAVYAETVLTNEKVFEFLEKQGE
ncbi:MAG TPA: trigger factor [Candidatus Paceibacterota bacterium]